MDRNTMDKLSMTLIHQAEDDCAEHDPGMVADAAMVLVGDVYALLVCRDDAPTHRPAPSRTRGRHDGLSPFIR